MSSCPTSLLGSRPALVFWHHILIRYSRQISFRRCQDRLRTYRNHCCYEYHHETGMRHVGTSLAENWNRQKGILHPSRLNKSQMACHRFWLEGNREHLQSCRDVRMIPGSGTQSESACPAKHFVRRRTFYPSRGVPCPSIQGVWRGRIRPGSTA